MEPESPEEDGLAPRTLEVLRRGWLAAVLGLVLFGGAAVGALAAAIALDGVSPIAGVLLIVGVLTLPLALHVGPLAAFAIALDERPRLRDMLGRVRRSLVVLAVVGLGMLLGVLFLGASVSGAHSILSGREPLALIWLVVVALVTGSWIQGAGVVGAARTLMSSDLRAPRGSGTLAVEVVVGLMLHGTLFAVLGPSQARGALGARAAETLTLVVVLVATPVAALLGSAMAVAVSGRPRSREQRGSSQDDRR